MYMRKIKSRAAAGLFLAVLVCLAASDKPKLVKIKVNNELTVMVPKEWIPMDEMDFTQRYPSVRAPLAAYTNEERTVDFSVNISATQWPDADLEISQKFFKSSLYNMFDKVELISEGIHEVNKKKFIFFEFESRVNGNKKELGQNDPVLQYTYIQYLIEPSRTLVFSFNCPRRLREEWQETAHEMMQKVTVKSESVQPSKSNAKNFSK
jgi:hypothetical protein